MRNLNAFNFLTAQSKKAPTWAQDGQQHDSKLDLKMIPIWIHVGMEGGLQVKRHHDRLSCCACQVIFSFLALTRQAF